MGLFKAEDWGIQIFKGIALEAMAAIDLRGEGWVVK